MNFKSLILGLTITVASASAFAQTFEIDAARTEYGKYIGLKAASPQLAKKSIDLAKTSIDKAVTHKKTIDNPAAWTYKALIYAELALADSANKANPNPLVVETVEAIKKAKQLDAAGENQKNIQAANDILYAMQVRKAINLYNSKKYKESYPEFVKGLEYAPGDTIINYYAAASAQNSADYPTAIKHYNELLKTNFSYLVDVYTNLAESYAANKDTAAAIKTLSEGSAKFPNSNQLVSREIEMSLNSGRQKEVVGKIEAQMQKEPTNKYYPFYLGLAYTSLKDVPKAEAAYKKAIEIDPNFTEAYINIATVIMNNGIDTYNDANKKFSGKNLTAAQLAEYNNIKKKATADFEKALPYLNKATELDPKSRIAWNGLRAYYQAKSNNAKVAEIEAKLKSL